MRPTEHVTRIHRSAEAHDGWGVHDHLTTSTHTEAGSLTSNEPAEDGAAIASAYAFDPVAAAARFDAAFDATYAPHAHVPCPCSHGCDRCACSACANADHELAHQALHQSR